MFVMNEQPVITRFLTVPTAAQPPTERFPSTDDHHSQNHQKSRMLISTVACFLLLQYVAR